jgi:hypothetical protein
MQFTLSKIGKFGWIRSVGTHGLSLLRPGAAG